MGKATISGALRNEIQDQVSRMLGRGEEAFTCPLDFDAQIKLWNDLVDPAVHQAVNILEAAGADVSNYRSDWAKFNTIIEGKPYTIFMYDERPGMKFVKVTCSVQPYIDAHRLVEVFPGGADAWAAFVQWVQNSGQVYNDGATTLKTLEEVLGFVNTIGQLTRAIPELGQYLYPHQRELLAGQKRASNMPFEWATYDRSKIDRLQFALAKAHLFPRGRNRQWGQINKSRAELRE